MLVQLAIPNNYTLPSIAREKAKLMNITINTEAKKMVLKLTWK